MPRSSEEEQDRRADEKVRAALPPGVELVQTLRGHKNLVYSVSFSPQGGLLASGSYDRTVKLWDCSSGQLLRTLEGHQGFIYSVSFSPQGGLLASGSDDRTVKLWDCSSGQLLRTLEGHQDWVSSVSFSPQVGTLASGSYDETVKLWDCSSGHLLRTLEGHKNGVSSVSFSPQGGTLASGSYDETVKLWDSSSGQLLRTLEGHKNGVSSVSFSPQGGALASGGSDRTVKLWDVSRGRLVRTLEGHTDVVTSVSFSRDGCLLASKGDDGTIRLWSVSTGVCVAVLSEPTAQGWLVGLSFHPREPMLAVAGVEKNAPNQSYSIHIYKYNPLILLGGSPPSSVAHISAKIVLLGESSVGKSCLAMRLCENRYPSDHEHGTTHGMRFWPMAPEQLSPTAVAPDGQRRDVVLWDMGGQDEYRLVHQLFLHDTTLALLLLDPTRGRTAFDEAEAWNKRLDKRLQGRPAVKLLVGAKLDQPSDAIDRQALERLRTDCGCAGFFETSAMTDRGIAELREAMAGAIDWDNLAKTTRPELFQRIRDEIETRRKRGDVVLHVADLHRALGNGSPSEDETKAVDAVSEQLAAQGVIARSQVATGEPVLVLQVQEIERYAGSLILAARNNPRGVPALEIRAIPRPDFALPGITAEDRLPRGQEGPVLECTVQLLLENGICFQHEGLLVFPTLFASAPRAGDGTPQHTLSLHYDFSGAIDNVYASLIAWLVLARDFGRVRLWADRAEFEIKDGGLCGLQKVGRPGGFARVDVYFEADTPQRRRDEFVSFVEEHLRQHDIEIQEHVAINCPCGHEFQEEVLRQRIARGDKDVVCPVCETRHNLFGGATESCRRRPDLAQSTWALKSAIEKRRYQSTKQAVRVLEEAAKGAPITGPIAILHLSDLHFTTDTPVPARLQWLLNDLRNGNGWGHQGISRLDYLVVSGDFTDRGTAEGFEKAYEFVSALTKEFALSAERCIFVPGNHDVCDSKEAYDWRENAAGLKDGEWVKQGDIVLARNREKYPLRLKPFSDSFFHKFLQRPYPSDYAEQGVAIPFWEGETGIQFLTLNSCWQIDRFNRKRAGVHPEAAANAIRQAQKQEDEARTSGRLKGPLLRIGVWHHAVTAPDYKMTDLDFLAHLQNNRVKIGLHGDVHDLRRDLVRYWHADRLHVIGAGSFGAPAKDRRESTPRLYNLLEIRRDLTGARVHTRQQPTPDGPWEGWNKWPDPNGGDGALPYYDITW